jgi:hemerythrin-like domain-containing protein
MDPETVKQQTELESGTLDQVSNALTAAISWKVKPKQLARKISTVRFVAQSFQRYLERLFSLEEHDGYMAVVQDQRPHWNCRIEELRGQHEKFRQTVRRITTRLERITPEERATFENLCHELLGVTKQVAKHNQRENKLLEDAFDVDDGGEG